MDTDGGRRAEDAARAEKPVPAGNAAHAETAVSATRAAQTETAAGPAAAARAARPETAAYPADAARPWYQLLSGNTLKLIALVTMLIDHVGAALLEMGVIEGYNTGTLAISYAEALRWWNVDSILRAIGRVSFPIYCFLIVEGFTHTRDVKRYAVRLGVFALLSEIPFDLAFYHTLWEPEAQNVFFTLLLGLLALAAVKHCEERGSRWVGLAAAFLCCVMGDVLCTDYGAFGVFFILVMYAFRGCGWLRTVAGCALTAWETTAPLAFIPICMYNGERGRLKMKYLFYAVYPLHLLVLYLIWFCFF